MPTFATTKVSERDQEYEMPIMTSQYIPNTEQTGINDCYILNTGFSIWAMDWCPTPSYKPDEKKKDVDYVAIGGLPETAETSIAQDQIYPLGKQDAQANMIQLWSMNCRTNDEGELQDEPSAYLTMCILHHYGAVLDLKWCPTGGLMKADSNGGSLARLGVLAGAFNDGTIRIFNVPDPSSLRDHLGMVTPGGSSPETIYIQYSEPYATLRLGDVNFMSINWGTAQRLAAGVTNGTVAVWDMNSMLSQPKETLLEKDSEYFDPIYLPQVHDVCVRTVDWLRSYDPEVLPWIIVTSGYDGHVRYTDLHDPFAQIDIKTILGVPMASVCIPWAEGTVYVDIDFGAKIDQLYLESRGFRLFNAKGTIWDFSYSDYQPFLAAAISDGRVKISNPAYKARRGYGMIQNHVYQIEEVSGNGGNAESNASTGKEDISEEAGQSQEKKEQVIRYTEGEEKEYISKSDGFLDFYGYNVAIQKVQWSRSYHSAAWLASGSAGGMVRVDNTMLRMEEGGSDNKIKYGPEPYIIKKRMANGAKYDEQGRRIGIDGQPVKIGRPKKPEAETYRGRIAIAKREKEARSLEDDQSGTTASGGNNKPTKGKGKGKANAKANAKGKGKKSATEGADEDDEAEDAGDVEEAGGGEDGVEESGDTSLSLTRKGSGLSSSLKIAPIFTRVRSTRGSAAAPAAAAAADQGEESIEHEAGVEEIEEDSHDQAESSSAAVAPRAVWHEEPTTPKRPRGRPRKDVSNPTQTKNLSVLSMMKSMTGPSQAEASVESETPSTDIDGDIAMAEEESGPPAPPEQHEDQDMQEAGNEVDISTSKSRKGKEKKVTTAPSEKTVGKLPPRVKGARAAVSKKAVADQEDGVQDTVDEEPESSRQAGTTPSSRASSVAPDSPRKKRGPSSAKKRKDEELKKQNQSLMDMWGPGRSKK
ncbi:hypothetical protein EDD21DRAFT_382653 [Dissophora ornata]|nr:hypothetical protein EDD21DRAFT_382653 [Dissophora ornata]